MKCPHCKKPVHIHSLVLGEGSKKTVYNTSLLKSAKISRQHLRKLIDAMLANGFKQNDIANILNITEGWVSGIMHTELAFERNDESCGD